jgi:hypothetical protein
VANFQDQVVNWFAPDVSIITLEGYQKGSRESGHPKAELERLQVKNITSY